MVSYSLTFFILVARAAAAGHRDVERVGRLVDHASIRRVLVEPQVDVEEVVLPVVLQDLVGEFRVAELLAAGTACYVGGEVKLRYGKSTKFKSLPGRMRPKTRASPGRTTLLPMSSQASKAKAANLSLVDI